MSGVLRESGQQSLGEPSCPERVLQHQMILWTKLGLGALAQTLADFRKDFRKARHAVSAKWVLWV